MNNIEDKILYDEKSFWFSQFRNSAMILKNKTNHESECGTLEWVWHVHYERKPVQQRIPWLRSLTEIYLYEKDKEIKWTEQMKHSVFYNNESFFLFNITIIFRVCFLAWVRKNMTTGEVGRDDNNSNKIR